MTGILVFFGAFTFPRNWELIKESLVLFSDNTDSIEK